MDEHGRMVSWNHSRKPREVDGNNGGTYHEAMVLWVNSMVVPTLLHIYHTYTHLQTYAHIHRHPKPCGGTEATCIYIYNLARYSSGTTPALYTAKDFTPAG